MEFFSDDYLMHYGVRGMKWKKRKAAIELNGAGDYSIETSPGGHQVHLGRNRDMERDTARALLTEYAKKHPGGRPKPRRKYVTSGTGNVTVRKKLTRREKAKQFASKQLKRVKGLRKKLPKMPKLTGEITVSHDVYYGGGKSRR